MDGNNFYPIYIFEMSSMLKNLYKRPKRDSKDETEANYARIAEGWIPAVISGK